MSSLKAFLFDNGDLVLGTIDGNSISFSKKTFTLYEPVKIKVQDMLRDGVVYESLILKAWFPCCDNESQTVQTSKVVSYADVTSELWNEQYDTFLMNRKFKNYGEQNQSSDFEEYEDNILDSNSLEDFINKMEEIYGKGKGKKGNLC